MRGRRTSEEIDEQTALAGVLIGKGRQHAAAFEQLFHLIEVAMLGEQFLPGALAEAAQELIEIRVVEWPGDGVRAESEEPQRVASHFPVAEMSGHEQDGPA